MLISTTIPQGIVLKTQSTKKNNVLLKILYTLIYQYILKLNYTQKIELIYLYIKLFDIAM